VKYTEEIDAPVIMTVRLGPDGKLSAKASASCEYDKGATASAEVDLPEATQKAIKAALDAAVKDVEPVLGKRLAQSRHDAFRVASAMNEIGRKVEAKKAPAKLGR
jgi:hypothetical protein